jgi:hypothetical protein
MAGTSLGWVNTSGQRLQPHCPEFVERLKVARAAIWIDKVQIWHILNAVIGWFKVMRKRLATYQMLKKRDGLQKRREKISYHLVS